MYLNCKNPVQKWKKKSVHQTQECQKSSADRKGDWMEQPNDEKTANPEHSSFVRKKTLKDYKYLPCVAAFLFLNFGLPRDPK